MDAISDRIFVDTGKTNAQNLHKVVDETPSLLTVILDMNPLEWKELVEKSDSEIEFNQVTSALLVMLNSHLALNSANQVALFIANSYHHGAKLIYPNFKICDQDKNKKLLKSKGIYRQFKLVDESILRNLDHIFTEEPSKLRHIVNKDNSHIKGTMSGAISRALSYINKIYVSEDNSNMKARIMIISVSGDNALPYVSMMNTIFAAQKMKVSLDVCKLGSDSIFLQQASDATNGVYIDIKNPKGLILYLTTALFIEPMLRPLIVLPTNTNIDFRASCFVTNKVVDIGYVCSVCLCILSVIPEDEKCPTCHSKFEHKLIAKLKRKPKVLPLVTKKKRKVDATTKE